MADKIQWCLVFGAFILRRKNKNELRELKEAEAKPSGRTLTGAFK